MATPTTLPATFVAGNVLTAAQMNDLRGAFRVLQVVQTVKTDTFSTTSSTFVDVTGLSVSITPSSTSSKILVYADCKMGQANGIGGHMRLVRDSTAIYVGDAAGNRRQATYGGDGSGQQAIYQGVGIYLDSPNTTSATTYKVQFVRTSGTVYLNRQDLDSDLSSVPRTASSITVMEISA